MKFSAFNLSRLLRTRLFRTRKARRILRDSRRRPAILERLEDRSLLAVADVTAVGAAGWFADDMRTAGDANHPVAGTDLVGTTLTHAGKPGQPATAIDDQAISQQLKIVAGPAGSTFGGAMLIDGTASNSGKSNVSVIDTASGFAAAGVLPSTFDATYQWYGQPNPTSRTLAFKIGVQSTDWAASQSTFTAIRSGESAWDLVLVHTPSSASDNVWSTEHVNANTGTWQLFRQAGNGYYPAPPATSMTLAAWNADPFWGPKLFGAGAKVSSVQFGLGSGQKSSISYVDYLQTNILNNGDVIDFGGTHNTYADDQASDYQITVDADNSGTLTPGDIVTWNGTVQHLTFGLNAFLSIQNAVNAVTPGGTVNVASGFYNEDVTVGTNGIKLKGAGPSSTTISGPIGGSGSTIAIAASNVDISGFKITRDGNNAVDWNNPNLNIPGVSIQGQSFTGDVIHDNLVTQNRTGIDINNSSGHTIRNNVITDNRTGLILRNQTDNLNVVENEITNNWTVGIVFLDASGGTNVPVQSALNSHFNNNDISGNWYGQIVDRQTGGSLPPPGANLKDFSGNWFGTATPVITSANSAEPGYAAQIPNTVSGGTATPPGGQPDIAGPASANFDITPYLDLSTDTNVETVPGRGTYGFQGDFSDLSVTSQLAQTGGVGRIQEGINLAADGSLVGGSRLVDVKAGNYNEVANVNKSLTLHGAAANASIVAPTTGAQQSVITVGATNVTIDGLAIQVNQNGGASPIAPVGISSVQGPDFNGLVIENNKITSIGSNSTQWTGSPGLGLRAAGIVLYDGPSGGIPSVTIANNNINVLSGTSFFQRGVWLAQLNAQITGNTLAGAANDLIFQFPSGGASLIDDNDFVGAQLTDGAGVLVGDPNSNSPVTISNNRFTPNTSLGLPTTSLQVNRNAAVGSPVSITGNAFTGYTTGIQVGGARDVSVTGNTFTPKAGIAGYVSVTVDSNNASNNADPTSPINTLISGNTFNSATGSTGTAVAIANNLPGSNFTGVTVTSNNMSGNTTGVNVVSHSTAEIASNSITGNGTGIFVGNSSVSIHDNTIASNADGIVVGANGTDTSSVNADGCNNISGNTNSGLTNNSPNLVNAEHNYWGSISGPTNPGNPGGFGDKVIGNVDFTPWSADPSCTVLVGGPASLQQDPCDPTKTALIIVGTDAKDNISVNAKGATQVEVKIDSGSMHVKQTFSTGDITGHIIVYALNGDDNVNVNNNVKISALIFGGQGKDDLHAGGGSSVIVGGDGDDNIVGGKGRDILIGGIGKDHLQGQQGDDILIGGTTDFDASIVDLCMALDQWNAPTPPGPSFSKFNATNVHDDGVSDNLEGAGGSDVYFANTTGPGSAKDKVMASKGDTVVNLGPMMATSTASTKPKTAPTTQTPVVVSSKPANSTSKKK